MVADRVIPEGQRRAAISVAPDALCRPEPVPLRRVRRPRVAGQRRSRSRGNPGPGDVVERGERGVRGPPRRPSRPGSHVVLASAGPRRYRRGMPSNSQSATHHRGRSRQQLQTHQVEWLTKRAEEQDRLAEERSRRWFMLNAITSTIITLGGGWLFWRLPPPQPQGRDVRVSGGTLHGVRGGGTPRITPPQVVSLSAGGRHRIRGRLTPTVKPADDGGGQLTFGKSRFDGPDTFG